MVCIVLYEVVCWCVWCGMMVCMVLYGVELNCTVLSLTEQKWVKLLVSHQNKSKSWSATKLQQTLGLLSSDICLICVKLIF